MWVKCCRAEVAITFRTVSYIALDKTFSGTVPQWQFLQDFEPLPDQKKKLRRPA